MNTILVINVDAKAISGAERYLPEPAMGNQKPGTTEYAAKWQEKRNKQIQDLSTHSFLAEPLSIQYAVLAGTATGFELVTPMGTVDSVKDFLGSLNPEGLDFIAGPHPTTHTRIVSNTALRHGIKLPLWLMAATRFNPWGLVAPQTEGEYPLSWVALGNTPVSPVEDTIALLRELGPGVLGLNS